jgi:hypothetical protein
MTLRSVWGVKAKAGKVGIELLAGVVNGLLVVRSVLSKHVASASRLPKAWSTCSQRVAAPAENGMSNANATKAQFRTNIYSSELKKHANTWPSVTASGVPASLIRAERTIGTAGTISTSSQ